MIRDEAWRVAMDIEDALGDADVIVKGDRVRNIVSGRTGTVEMTWVYSSSVLVRVVSVVPPLARTRIVNWARNNCRKLRGPA